MRAFRVVLATILAVRLGALRATRLPALLALALALTTHAARAQPAPHWESLGVFSWTPTLRVHTLTFHRDSLFAANDSGFFVYDPDHAPHGDYGNWLRRCYSTCGPRTTISSAGGALLVGADAGPTTLDRSEDAGRTWVRHVGTGVAQARSLLQTTLPALDGAILAGFGGSLFRSDDDGRLFTWRRVPTAILGGDAIVLFEVPPAPAMPTGRILAGVWNGLTLSDDAETFRPSSLYGQGRYIGYSFAFAPDPAHPYGGVVYAGVQNAQLYPSARAEVHRSEDGGQTWTLAHRFSRDELELPVGNGTEAGSAILHVSADGALWAGVNVHQAGPPPWPGRIVRSTDGGATWSFVDAGLFEPGSPGAQVNALAVGPDGRLYAGTDLGVWRTVQPVSAAGVPAGVPSETLRVSVRPNPGAGRVAVVVALAGPASSAEVGVYDAQGRRLALLHDGPLGSGETSLRLEVAGWPPGVYVARVAGDGLAASTPLIVVR